MRALVVAIVAACLGLARVAADGQGTTSPSQPTFRAGTTLVDVSAVVTRDGQPVTDLRREDFTVLDNGVPQPLVAYEYVDLGRGETPAQRRDFLIVIDDLHIAARRTQQTIAAALAFIDALGPHDRLAVVHTGPPDVAIEFTTDRDAARALVRRTRGQQLAAAPAPGELDLRARMALDVLRQVAASLRDDAGERRAVLFISEGHPTFSGEPSAFATRDAQLSYFEFLDLLRAAALGNVAIYTIDPRGLRAQDTAGVPSRLYNTTGDAGPSLGGDLHGSLAALALNTGGRQTYWTNDITKNFARLLQDSRQYYRLAYLQPDPPPGKSQPRVRTIKVKVSREGVQVRARQRYAPAGDATARKGPS